jgi:hypothetical protein
MNSYLYNVTIFDTAVDADLTVFPKVEPYAVVAENETEAQRKIVEQLFDEAHGGVLAKHSRPDDSATRFNIVFNEPERSTVVKPLQLRKAELPIDVTEPGMVAK